MSYEDALKATGNKVLDYQEFGDYQGTWYALMIINGKLELISGEYGSCSGCDAFDSAFDYDLDFNSIEGKEQLKRFGQQYIDNNISDPRIELKNAEEDAKWDLDSKEKLEWLEKIKHLLSFEKKLDSL